jgi:nitrate reductase gamma subunit
VEEIISFARGPFFRLTILLMIFGLIRTILLDLWGAYESYRRAGDKKLDWGGALKNTFKWLFPIKMAFTGRPAYSLFSIIFHIGLLVTPVFLLAHIQLWESSIGIGWIALSHFWADLLTIVTIVSGLALLIGRIGSRGSRILSRFQDYLWPILIVIPFISGYFCANLNLSPTGHQLFMLIHILSGELIFILIPFTKIAHCVLFPLSQFIISLSWKFPARVNDNIEHSLNKKGAAA